MRNCLVDTFEQNSNKVYIQMFKCVKYDISEHSFRFSEQSIPVCVCISIQKKICSNQFANASYLNKLSSENNKNYNIIFQLFYYFKLYRSMNETKQQSNLNS